MPSTSAKQHRFMQAVAHSPSFAKKAGVSQSVGKDFSAADKGKTFNKGGDTMESKKMMGKEVAFMKKKGAPSSMIKHEEKESKGMKFGRGGGMPPPSGARPDPRMMAAMMAARRPRMGAGMPPSAPPVMPPPPPGGMPPPAQPPMGMKKGGMPMKDGKPAFMQKKMNMGGMYAKGGMKKMAGGGLAAGHKAADGVAHKGKTKAKKVVMAGNKGMISLAERLR